MKVFSQLTIRHTARFTQAENRHSRGHCAAWFIHHEAAQTLICRRRHHCNGAFDRDAEAIEVHDPLRNEDPVLTWISDRMIHEVAEGGPGGRLCYDALALQASVHILRNLPRCNSRCRARRDASAAHTRLIEDYVEQNPEASNLRNWPTSATARRCSSRANFIYITGCGRMPMS
jgi:AraC family transcriptional regulator